VDSRWPGMKILIGAARCAIVGLVSGHRRVARGLLMRKSLDGHENHDNPSLQGVPYVVGVISDMHGLIRPEPLAIASATDVIVSAKS
jgi:hypothetical protein